MGATPLLPQASLMCVHGFGLYACQLGRQGVPVPHVTESYVMLCRQVGVAGQVVVVQVGVLPECIGPGPTPFLGGGHGDP